MTITSAQIRAARGLLNWTQSELADRTGISSTTIGTIEKGDSHPREETAQIIKAVLEDAGISFTENGGVEPYKNMVRLYQGSSGLKRFMDDVYETAKSENADICLFNTTPENWLKLLGEEWCEFHYKRMMDIKTPFRFRAITRQKNDILIGQGFIEYKWIPEHLFNEKTFYCYGDNLAFIDFLSNDVKVWVLEHAGFANGFRTLFQISWDQVGAAPILKKEKDLKKA